MNKSGLLVVLAVTVMMTASNAQALTAYVPEGLDGCCTNSASAKNASSVHRVGAFVLDGVSADKTGPAQCSLKSGCPVHKTTCPLTGVGEVLAGPVILVGAVANDVHYLLTMPYRQTERLN